MVKTKKTIIKYKGVSKFIPYLNSILHDFLFNFETIFGSKSYNITKNQLNSILFLQIIDPIMALMDQL